MNSSSLRERFENLGAQSRPVYGSIEITNTCNAHCRYCYIDSESAQPELSGATWIQIIDKLYDSGVMFLHITGGEVFLHPEVLKILDYACSKDFFHIKIFTNGTCLQPEHFDFLGAHAKFITYIQVSIFSHHAKIHDEYTGVPGGLDSIIKTAARLQSFGIRTIAMYNLLPSNIDEMNQAKSWLQSNGLEVYFGLLKIKPFKERYSPENQVAQTPEFLKTFFSHSGPQFRDDHRNLYNNRNANGNKAALLCKEMALSITVDAHGDLYPCNTFRKKSFGSIFDKRPLQTILAESTPRAHLVAMTHGSIAKCAQCEHFGFCAICPALMNDEDEAMVNPPTLACAIAETVKEIATTPYERTPLASQNTSLPDAQAICKGASHDIGSN